jgi:hypothetical protein
MTPRTEGGMTPGRTTSWSAAMDSARLVADAVLYEGYLLYPYRASAGKNQSRWQFGVLGPPGAAAAGVGEEPEMAAELLVRHRPDAEVTVALRFLQLQARMVEQIDGTGRFAPVAVLRVDGQRWLSWDEAVEHEVPVTTARLRTGGAVVRCAVAVDGGEEVTDLVDADGATAGRLIRRRWPLVASVELTSIPVAEVPGVSRLRVVVVNATDPGTVPGDPAAVGAVAAQAAAPAAGASTARTEAAVAATRRSFLGAHLLLGCSGGWFVSMTDPPDELETAARSCRQQRCWPVLAGPAGKDDVALVSPIILEDHPTLAAQSPGSLFDSTEIDEILTLRILTMTDEEKAEARATDPRAAHILDRTEQLSPQDMAQLHGLMYDPLGTTVAPGVASAAADTLRGDEADVPWWDPERDGAVDPSTDAVTVAGVRVCRGSLVVLRPSRRADAQDLFLAGQTGRVTGVHFDVDGATHVGVVLVDDPAADLHEWYGRYLYFGPEELEPLGATAPGPDTRRETSS